MTHHLVIGGDGFVGKALRRQLAAMRIPHKFTSRRPDSTPYLDLRTLAEPNLSALGFPDVVYLVAAVPTFKFCALEPHAWQVNADAPIMLARYFARQLAFPVFVSSDAVEWSNEWLAVHKRHAESYLNTIDAAIVRPGRITDADAFARELIAIAAERKAGVYRYDEKTIGASLAPDHGAVGRKIPRLPDRTPAAVAARRK